MILTPRVALSPSCNMRLPRVAQLPKFHKSVLSDIPRYAVRYAKLPSSDMLILSYWCHVTYLTRCCPGSPGVIFDRSQGFAAEITQIGKNWLHAAKTQIHPKKIIIVKYWWMSRSRLSIQVLLIVYDQHDLRVAKRPPLRLRTVCFRCLGVGNGGRLCTLPAPLKQNIVLA